MKLTRFIHVLAVAVLLFGAAGTSYTPSAAQGEGSSKPDQSYMPGEIVVGFAPGRSFAAYTGEASAVASSLKARLTKVTPGGIALLKAAPDADVKALASKLRAQSGAAIPNLKNGEKVW